MRLVSLVAPAKLNLHLGIYPELDERRYHRADSVMVALDLSDEVEVEELPSGAQDDVPKITCYPSLKVSPQKNTAYRAAVALAERLGREPNVSITIHKRVPDQAGMGGSSSDAAAVLRALCELWETNADDPRVLEAARSVGADVPFFLDPVPTLLVGAGDVVSEKFPPLPRPISVALIRPMGPGVSTPAAYAAYDEAPTQPADASALCDVLRSGTATARDIAPLLANNLDPVARRLMPAIDSICSWLLEQHGVLGGQVTGSGSCVFGLFDSDDDAEYVVRRAQDCFDVWATTAYIR